MVRLLISFEFWAVAFIRETRIFWSNFEKVRCLLERSDYLSSGFYQRKYDKSKNDAFRIRCNREKQVHKFNAKHILFLENLL